MFPHLDVRRNIEFGLRRGQGKGANAGTPMEEPAVTLTVAKRKGTNAATVVERVMEKLEGLRERGRFAGWQHYLPLVVEIVAGGPADKSGLLHPDDKIIGVGQGYDGEIEEIGLRSTKIRTLSGHQINIPNQELAKLDIENIGRRPFYLIH